MPVQPLEALFSSGLAIMHGRLPKMIDLEYPFQ